LKRKFVFIVIFLTTAVALYGQSGRVQIYSENSPPEKSKKKTETPNGAKTSVTKDDDDVIRIETDLVMIPARVTDRSGKPVSDLKKAEFKIFENDVEQEIAYFSGEDQPFTVALVLDMSYSSVFKLAEIQTAALEFINQLRADDKVLVASFDEKFRVLCKPTNDRKVLRYAVEGAQIASGTSLYAALDAVLENELAEIAGRRAIVLLSDGVDTASKNFSANDVLEKFAETDVIVYPIQYDTYDDVQKSRKQSAQIFYDDDDRPYVVEKPRVRGERESDYAEANRFLRQIADQSGGRVYPVTSATNLNRAFAHIAEELRKIYSLGYYPSGERSAGADYAIRVRVYRPNLSIQARNKYVWKPNRKNVK
jgi:Ca-activated chloride channel homolog